jgi:hypothetical protein
MKTKTQIMATIAPAPTILAGHFSGNTSVKKPIIAAEQQAR